VRWHDTAFQGEARLAVQETPKNNLQEASSAPAHPLIQLMIEHSSWLE